MTKLQCKFLSSYIDSMITVEVRHFLLFYVMIRFRPKDDVKNQPPDSSQFNHLSTLYFCNCYILMFL